MISSLQILQLISVFIGAFVGALIANKITSKRDAKILKFNVADANTPILTVKQDDIELNFIIDTGSSVSAIDTSALNQICSQKLKKSTNVVGIEGTFMEVDCYEIPFSYNDYEYNHTFVAKDFTAAFTPLVDVIKKPIHGLIGSDFCDQHGFIIDFQNCTINAK